VKDFLDGFVEGALGRGAPFCGDAAADKLKHKHECLNIALL